jgi:Holliday junction resolvase
MLIFCCDQKMNLMLNGEERTLAGFVELLAESGWKVVRVDATGLSSPQQHIVTVPI